MSEAWGRTGASYINGSRSYAYSVASNATTSTNNHGGFVGAKSRHSTSSGSGRVDGWIERAGAWW
ncbi:MAG: hypothetical protein ACRC6X_06645 [Culicoidibacterales bacterium]